MTPPTATVRLAEILIALERADLVQISPREAVRIQALVDGLMPSWDDPGDNGPRLARTLASVLTHDRDKWKAVYRQVLGLLAEHARTGAASASATGPTETAGARPPCLQVSMDIGHVPAANPDSARETTPQARRARRRRWLGVVAVTVVAAVGGFVVAQYRSIEPPARDAGAGAIASPADAMNTTGAATGVTGSIDAAVGAVGDDATVSPASPDQTDPDDADTLTPEWRASAASATAATPNAAPPPLPPPDAAPPGAAPPDSGPAGHDGAAEPDDDSAADNDVLLPLLIALSLVVAVLGARWLSLARAHRRALRDQVKADMTSGHGRDPHDQVRYRVDRAPPFDTAAMDDAATVLARIGPRVEGRHLDVDRTLDRVSRSAGRMFPVFQRVRRQTPTLILVDVEEGDHPFLAGVEWLLEHWSRIGLAFERIDYRLRPDDLSKNPIPTTLADLARTRAGRPLLLFSRLAHPGLVAGRAAWIEALRRPWPTPILIDLDPRSDRERRRLFVHQVAEPLRRHGIERVPFTADGLRAAAQLAAGRPTTVPDSPDLPAIEPALDGPVARRLQTWAACASYVPDPTWLQLDALRRHIPALHAAFPHAHDLQRLLDWAALWSERRGYEPAHEDRGRLWMSEAMIETLQAEERTADDGRPDEQTIEHRARSLLLDQLYRATEDRELTPGSRQALKIAVHEAVLGRREIQALIKSFAGGPHEAELHAALAREASVRAQAGPAVIEAEPLTAGTTRATREDRRARPWSRAARAANKALADRQVGALPLRQVLAWRTWPPGSRLLSVVSVVLVSGGVWALALLMPPAPPVPDPPPDAQPPMLADAGRPDVALADAAPGGVMLDAATADAASPSQPIARADPDIVIPTEAEDPRQPSGRAPTGRIDQSVTDLLSSEPLARVFVPTGRNLGMGRSALQNLPAGQQMPFIRLSGGTFLMGSPDSETGRDADESPRHRVRVSGFEIGQYEVTQAQWEAVMGNKPSYCGWGCGPNRPVQNVSWLEAIEFLNRLTERENQRLPADQQRTPCYDENRKWKRGCTGYRLPTEAEWEYAARAGTMTAYSFGDEVAKLGEYAWYDENWGGSLHPVGDRKGNPWGLHDVHGNVWEWCWDWYADKYQADPQAAPRANPIGPMNGTYRVVRGGSAGDQARVLRSANRSGNGPGYRVWYLGLRVVRAAAPAGSAPTP
ncbi:SUMF1/EgtB/PvdO family nonheme iron enzyme [Haliangium sp.]|uniref:SUMF1/EgtB/PvdO family nonheme iron enzyme n=1 Tax=Haliangium sp. TaxID=2663208 RepID=UPI003D14A897